MTLMRDLTLENNIRAEDVVHVKVGTNQNMLNALIPHRPADELQAKFSMEFCMAVLLLDGKTSLSQFTDETVERPDL